MGLKRPRRGPSKRARKQVSESRSESQGDPKEKRSRRSRERRQKRPEGPSETREKRAQRSRQAGGGAQKAGTALKTGGIEVLAIAREMVAIPAGYALRLAEWLGLGILAVLRWLRPIALAALRLARRALEVAAREITPARALAAVTLAAAVLLAVSQFLDYRDVQAGVPAYAGVEEVAPPPTVSGTTETAGSAHLYVLLLAAIAAGVIVVLSMLGRWRLARLLVPIGLASLLVIILIDAPSGLDEGATAIQFQGAEARLLGAFWVEVTSAAVIALCGAMLAATLRPQRARRAKAAKPAGGLRRLLPGRRPVHGAQS